MLNNWKYEKYDKDFNRTACPMNDKDGSITGKVIINLKAYFDENPDERKKLGWIKHYYYDIEEIEEMYDKQTQYYETKSKIIDDYTMVDEVMVFDKTEDMLAHEEMYGVRALPRNFIIF